MLATASAHPGHPRAQARPWACSLLLPLPRLTPAHQAPVGTAWRQGARGQEPRPLCLRRGPPYSRGRGHDGLGDRPLCFWASVCRCLESVCRGAGGLPSGWGPPCLLAAPLWTGSGEWWGPCEAQTPSGPARSPLSPSCQPQPPNPAGDQPWHNRRPFQRIGCGRSRRRGPRLSVMSVGSGAPSACDACGCGHGGRVFCSAVGGRAGPLGRGARWAS